MRIGIDARELAGRPTGVGRYLSSVLAEWAVSPGRLEHEFVLYLPSAPSAALAARLSALPHRVRVVPGGGGLWWEQAQLPGVVRADRLDVLFAPAYTAPVLLRCPVVLTIHDLSYLAHPEWFRPRERWRRTLLTRAAAGRARRILTVSAFSQAEVTRLLGVPATRVTVVPLGLGLPPGPETTEPRLPLVLYVGSIFNRRRVPDLVAAFAQMAGRPGIRLEIVGENRSWPYQDIEAVIRAHGLAGAVGVRSWLPDEALAELYGRASAFVFLSEYEGFGLTPLEALSRGVPIVVLDTPVAREVYGEAAVYVRAGDIAGTAAAVSAVLDDGAVRRRILDSARELLPRYSWPRAAAATLTAIVEAAG